MNIRLKALLLSFLFFLNAYESTASAQSWLGGNYDVSDPTAEWLISKLPADKIPFPSLWKEYRTLCESNTQTECKTTFETTSSDFKNRLDICQKNPSALCFLDLARIARLKYPCKYDAACDSADGQAYAMAIAESHFGNLRLAIRYAYEIQSMGYLLLATHPTVIHILQNHGYCALAQEYVDKIEPSYKNNKDEDFKKFELSFIEGQKKCTLGQNISDLSPNDFLDLPYVSYGMSSDLDKALRQEILKLPLAKHQEITDTLLLKDLNAIAPKNYNQTVSAIKKYLQQNEKDPWTSNMLRINADMIGILQASHGQYCDALQTAYMPDPSDATINLYLALAVSWPAALTTCP